jgi:hypothetical protein
MFSVCPPQLPVGIDRSIDSEKLKKSKRIKGQEYPTQTPSFQSQADNRGIAMALVSVEALYCFNFIAENFPSWASRVDDLAVYTATKQAELSDKHEKLTHVQHKNNPCRSIRPVQENHASVPPERDVTGSTAKAAPGPNTRKRGTEQAPSIQSADGPQVIRIRHIIHYDGHPQSELEQVVWDIGSARNNIRKGRMTQLMKKPNSALDMFSKRILLREASVR